MACLHQTSIRNQHHLRSVYTPHGICYTSGVRLKLTIAYDGTRYGGWQSQPNADTIQDLIEHAIAQTIGENTEKKIRLHGSGRTDAGVHALGQIAHFDAPDHLTMNPYNWVPALNTKLPADIRIVTCEETPADFHSRFSATGKTYTYDLCLSPILPPFLAGRAWHLPRQLDPHILTDTLALFLGEHNFQSFSAKRGNETSETDYHRTLSASKYEITDTGYRITFSGNGFLYKMVRLLTGAAVKTAQGQARLDDIQALLAHPSNEQKSPLCAPADGLILQEVSYQ
nr:tRNA pseudouridine synthase A-like [Nerophis lumbriciformis]